MTITGVLLLCGAAIATGEDAPEAGSEATYLKNVRQLTFEGLRAGEGYFSTDAKRFVFAAEREVNPSADLYVLRSGRVTASPPGSARPPARTRSDRVLFASTTSTRRGQKQETRAARIRQPRGITTKPADILHEA
jgi:hypothetical protein